jgi:hypothetical protein
LEKLNQLCGTKHDIFCGAKLPRKRLQMEMEAPKIDKVEDKTMET